MGRLQPLAAKRGEIKFRQKLIKQHKDEKIHYPFHTSSSEIISILKDRAERSLKIFQDLKSKRVILSPFLELGGEKCERAAILASKMDCQGFVIDLSAESLESANHFCPQIGLKKIPVRVCADAYRLPFADNSLPFVFTFQTLHHFPDPTPVIQEAYRVLAPGGYFYFDEEPVKQLLNPSLWRRDWHLVWWEKILKAIFILPLVSTLGKAEVSEGALEESFDLATWEKSLDCFNQVKAEIIPLLGPKTKIQKNGKGWLKPKASTKLMINLLGGGIKGLCQKKGQYKMSKENLYQLLVCPDCRSKLKKEKNFLACLKCAQKYPIKNQVLYLLPHVLAKKLYP